MRRFISRVMGVVSVIGQSLMLLYFSWFLLQQPLKGLVVTLGHATVTMAMHVVIIGGIIAVAIHLLERRYEWLDENVYWALSRTLKGKPKRTAEVLSLSAQTFRPNMFYLSFGGTHWLSGKIERLVTHLSLLLFWPMTIAGYVSLAYDSKKSALYTAVVSNIVLFLLAVLGMRLRNLAVAALLMLWLGIVFTVWGEIHTAVHAALLGACLTLWGLWGKWRDKISEYPERPVDPEPKPT